MSAPLPLRFVTSADRVDRLPPSRNEVAVMGRSNVGKSSLINALANRKQLARTSKTPGRTQLLNCFEVAEGATLVDCPGYGYAAAPGQVRVGLKHMVQGYLQGRQPLRMVLLLVDGAVGPTDRDEAMLAWLRDHDLPIHIAATKHDKVKSSKRRARAKDLATGCGVPIEDVVWVSATAGTGIDRLRGLIRGWLAL